MNLGRRLRRAVSTASRQAGDWLQNPAKEVENLLEDTSNILDIPEVELPEVPEMPSALDAFDKFSALSRRLRTSAAGGKGRMATMSNKGFGFKGKPRYDKPRF